METSADTRCGHCKYENLMWIDRVSSRSGLTPFHFALAVKNESGIREVRCHTHFIFPEAKSHLKNAGVDVLSLYEAVIQ